MKANPDKCHFICSSNSELSLTVENEQIKNSKCQKLLGVKIDSKLTFNTHINDICRKAAQKINAISRITPYLDFSKKRLLVNTFFFSQFSYCQLTWMCHNRTNKNKINMKDDVYMKDVFDQFKTIKTHRLKISWKRTNPSPYIIEICKHCKYIIKICKHTL